MPFTVPFAFDRFLENITISGDHRQVATTRRDAIVKLLGGEFTIVEAISMGSLSRGTALKGFADVDVLVALHWSKHVKDRSPREVLDCVRDHLSTYNAKYVMKNGQAITLHFETWPNVDIVPGHQVVEGGTITGYRIPDMNRGLWIGTEPRIHASKMDKSFARAPALRGLLRMLKEWNRVHSSYMQSFHIEAIARKLRPTDSDWPWSVLLAFERFVELARAPLFYPKNSGRQIDDYLSADDRRELVQRLETAKTRALHAWYATHKGRDDHKGAIEEYRRIFGDRFPAYG